MSIPVRPAPPPNGAARSGSVLVVDDHAVVREGLRAVLAAAQGVVVVGDAADEEAGIELVARRRPDLVLIEPRMPGIGGVEVARRIAARHPATRVAMFTARADQDLLWEALEAGAQGFILKDTESPALVAVIRRLLAGETFVDPRPPEGPLSAREREVLQMLADGLSNREASERLVVSAETVKTHVKNILVKLKADGRAQAVAIGIRQGLID